MSNYCSDIVWKRDLGSDKRKLICARLADHADDEGRGIWPSVERVAAQCNVSERTVQRVLSELVGEGLLIVVDEGGRGPSSTRRYDFDMARLEALPLVEWGAKKAKNKGDTVSPLAGNKGDSLTEKGDSLSQKGCHGDTQTPIEPSGTLRGRAQARAEREGDGEEEREKEKSDTPGTADFEKRVMRFCNGHGFAAGPWPDWDASSPGYIGKQFAKLEPDDRVLAERWRDVYLADMKERKCRPVPVGVFLRDRLWTGFDPARLERAEKQRQGEQRPADWGAALGPVWSAARLAALLRNGPIDEAMIAKLDQEARFGRGFRFSERYHELGKTFVAVPVDSELCQTWRKAFDARGWSWPPTGTMAVVWFPPAPDGVEDAIASFEAAWRSGEGQQEREGEAAE